jgi:hypothetical protein
MAKLLYVEPNDQITDLVDRIRRAEGERDLVFVVPPQGHVLRSPLDMRLLMQYTRGFQKRIAIVSGDPQIQALAMRTGFPTFPSLARLEQGAPLRGVPDITAAAAATTAAAGAAPTRALARRSPATLVTATEGGAAGGWWERFKGWWRTQRGRNLTIAGGLGIFVVGVLAVLFLLPSATVTLGVPAHHLTDTATIQGSVGTRSGVTLDQIPARTVQSSTLSQNFTVTPSGTQALAPVAATGTLEFCSGSSTGLTDPTLSFDGSAAPSFVDQGTSGVSFTPTVAGESDTVALPLCSVGTSTGVPVQADASTVGTAGNVGSSAWTWPNASGTECVGPSAHPGECLSPAPSLTVANQAAMTGGQDAKTQSVFSTTDAAAAQQQEQTVDLSLTKEAEQQLKNKAGSDVVAESSAGSGIQLTVTNPTLPAGCNTSASTPCPAATTQTLTVTVSASASAYSPAAAKAAALQDLRTKVPSQSVLLSNPEIGTPEVVSAGAGGAVTLSVRAVGYWAAKLDLEPFRAKLAFMSPGAARTYLRSRLPGSSTVVIKQSPFGLPWLPILSGRIQLVRVSISQGHHAG